MLSKNMLLGLLKPLLPKLEGFLQNQKLEDGEEAKFFWMLKIKRSQLLLLLLKK